MDSRQLEEWVLRIAEQVTQGQPIEDARVELKGEWIDETTAARRIAGHANAARSAFILWIIGLDEIRGVRGATRTDLAKWWPQVQKCFNELPPDLLLDINVPVGTNTVVALLIDASRAPYVVKNPMHNQPGGGPVELETPWREGTRVRSARRSDLLRLLVPLLHVPNVKVRSGDVRVRREAREATHGTWALDLDLYFTPQNAERVVIPFDDCEAMLEVPGVLPASPIRSQLRLEPRYQGGPLFGFYTLDAPIPPRQPESPYVNATSSEAILTGPGVLKFHAFDSLPLPLADGTLPPAQVTLRLRLEGADELLVIQATLNPLLTPDGESWVWTYMPAP